MCFDRTINNFLGVRQQNQTLVIIEVLQVVKSQSVTNILTETHLQPFLKDCQRLSSIIFKDKYKHFNTT